MTSTEIDARYERAQQALDLGTYQIDKIDGVSLYDWCVSYTDKKGQPVSYLVNTSTEAGTCTCPDFAKRGGPCKHVLMSRIQADRIARFEAEMDAILAEIEGAKEQPSKPHTVEYDGCHFWRLYLETDLTPAELRERLGDLTGKLEIGPNRLRGYGRPVNREYPTKLQARLADLTEAEKAEVYRRIGIA